MQRGVIGYIIGKGSDYNELLKLYINVYNTIYCWIKYLFRC